MSTVRKVMDDTLPVASSTLRRLGYCLAWLESDEGKRLCARKTGHTGPHRTVPDRDATTGRILR